jgi:hypothetical protein
LHRYTQAAARRALQSGERRPTTNLMSDNEGVAAMVGLYKLNSS